MKQKKKNSLQTAELSSRERLNIRLRMSKLLVEQGKRKPEVNPLAALLPYIKRLRLDKSLSLNLSGNTSKRFRTALLTSAFSGNMYGSIGISNIVAIYAKRPRLGCFPSSSIAWRCRGEISSVSANFSRVIFWASRKVLMSSPIGVKSNPYLFFLFFPFPYVHRLF